MDLIDQFEEERVGSGCCGDNCLNPGAPEYGKCWKKKNNSGCCGLVGVDGEDHKKEETVRVVRSTRRR